jgi:phosphoribosylglycinamide formyltransferase-1
VTTRIVLLISGAGSNARSLLDSLDSSAGTIDATVVAVGSDKDAPGFAHAAHYDLPTFQVPLNQGDDRDAWGERLIAEINRFEPDLVILSGFMRLVPSNVVERYSPALWNTHPAFLPEFPGAHAVADAMAAGVSETGASVIVVDNGVDTGPILAQRRVAINPGDTEESVHERIKTVERELLFDLVSPVSAGELTIEMTESGTAHV